MKPTPLVLALAGVSGLAVGYVFSRNSTSSPAQPPLALPPPLAAIAPYVPLVAPFLLTRSPSTQGFTSQTDPRSPQVEGAISALLDTRNLPDPSILRSYAALVATSDPLTSKRLSDRAAAIIVNRIPKRRPQDVPIGPAPRSI